MTLCRERRPFPSQEANDRASSRTGESPSSGPGPAAACGDGCVACAAPRRYRRRLCRPCWERFSRDGLEMPPRASKAEPIGEYLGRVLAKLPRRELARAVAIALGSHGG